MRALLTIATFALGLLAPPANAGEPFHIYAPNRTTNKLVVVEASESKDGLSLDLLQEIDLGFPAATIVAHPGEPTLYIAAAVGAPGDTPGAIVSLASDGGYASHKLARFAHGYCYLSLDRTNRYLLGANYNDGFVDVYALDDAQTLGARVTAVDEGRPNAHCVQPSPDNRYVYVPYVKGANAIYQYRFSPETGSLKALEPINASPPTETGPRHLAYHPHKPLIYFSNEQHLGASVYSIQPSGHLELVQVCDAVAPETPTKGVTASDLALTPDARFLFCGIRAKQKEFDWIARYRVKENGELELLGLTRADDIPWGLTLSPDGRYLLVAATEGASLTAYKIGERGSLRRVARLPWEKKVTDLIAR